MYVCGRTEGGSSIEHCVSPTNTHVYITRHKLYKLIMNTRGNISAKSKYFAFIQSKSRVAEREDRHYLGSKTLTDIKACPETKSRGPLTHRECFLSNEPVENRQECTLKSMSDT